MLVVNVQLLRIALPAELIRSPLAATRLLFLKMQFVSVALALAIYMEDDSKEPLKAVPNGTAFWMVRPLTVVAKVCPPLMKMPFPSAWQSSTQAAGFPL